MRNPFLNLILVATLHRMQILKIIRDLHGQQDSERSDGFKGGGYKETFKFGFYNLLKYLLMNVGHLIEIDIFR